MIHALKTLPEYFEAVKGESKTFEIRKGDRPFWVGDFLALNEWDDEAYTGRALIVEITYILDNPDYCKEGFVALGISGCAIRRKNNLFAIEVDCFKGIPVYGGAKKP